MLTLRQNQTPDSLRARVRAGCGVRSDAKIVALPALRRQRSEAAQQDAHPAAAGFSIRRGP